MKVHDKGCEEEDRVEQAYWLQVGCQCSRRTTWSRWRSTAGTFTYSDQVTCTLHITKADNLVASEWHAETTSVGKQGAGPIGWQDSHPPPSPLSAPLAPLLLVPPFARHVLSRMHQRYMIKGVPPGAQRRGYKGSADTHGTQQA